MELFHSKWKILRYQEIPVVELIGTMEESPVAKEILVKVAANMIEKALISFEAKVVLDKIEKRNFPTMEGNNPTVVTRLAFNSDEKLEEFVEEISSGNIF